MKEELRRHYWAYLILMIGVVMFVVIFLGVWPNRPVQRLVIVSMALFYWLWGALTHFKTKTISKSVVWEYGMVATLAAILLLLITV